MSIAHDEELYLYIGGQRELGGWHYDELYVIEKGNEAREWHVELGQVFSIVVVSELIPWYNRVFETNLLYGV